MGIDKSPVNAEAALVFLKQVSQADIDVAIVKERNDIKPYWNIVINMQGILQYPLCLVFADGRMNVQTVNGHESSLSSYRDIILI